MNIEEYKQVVSDQIRSKKARPHVIKELEDHINDQAAVYEAEGKSREEALSEAVIEMGDPTEVGVELDRIHRPQMSWETIVLVGLISIASFVIQLFLQSENTVGSFGISQLVSIIIGFIFMIIIYRIDYSVIGKYSRPLAAFFLFSMVIGVLYFCSEINGAKNYIMIGRYMISISPIILLYIPLFGAILYSYKRKGYDILWQLFLWAGIPVLITFKIPSLLTAVILLFSMAFLFTIAVAKGWYRMNRKGILITMWSILILLPTMRIGYALLKGSPTYQMNRLVGWLTRDEQINYTSNLLHEIIAGSNFAGKSDYIQQISSPVFLELNTDFVLVGVMSMYGIIAAAVIIALLVGLIIKIFHISFKQKNQLGMIIGAGCGMVFLMQTVTNIMVVFNLIPMTGVSLPLFSYARTGIIVSYILLGIVLSIYRNKDILYEKRVAIRQ